MTRLLVATTNAGKVSELVPLLGRLGYAPVGLDAVAPLPVAAETGATFAAHARSKAEHYGALSGLPVLADDSGLEVAALDGAPGVRSARFAGEQATDAANNALLLERMAGATDRRAAFVCALCLRQPDGSCLEVAGRCEGRLATAPRGTNGFGYDPLFVPDDAAAGGRTFAELDPAGKRALSHRGRALAALAAALAARAAERAR